MRIVYLCHWNLSRPDGVAKKIAAQAALWRAAGHDVTVLALSPGGGRDGGGVRAFPYGDGRSRATASRRLVAAARQLRPDLVYVRYDLFLPRVWELLLRRRTVVEVNSDDRAEYRRFVRWRGRRALLYNELNRRAILGAADGIVYVTPELQASPDFAAFRAPSAVVPNGVLFSETQELPAPANARPRAVFLASPRQAWHGVDRLAALARALPGLDVDLVGYTAADLARSVPDPPPNLRPHGRLTRAEYEPLLAGADVGIGTLALHRKDMSQAAPLKVREYLAAGLPVAIAYDDVDLAGIDAWWLLRLPNDESNGERAAELEAFVASVRGRRVPRAEAAPLVSLEAKEARRLAFLERVVMS